MQPTKFATVNKIAIFHVHKNGFGDGRETIFWYSTSDRRASHEAYSFDVRDLGCNPEKYEDGWLEVFEEKAKRCIRKNLRNGNIKVPSSK